jgi:hypothetical protein
MPSTLRPGSSDDIETHRIEAAWLESPWWLRSQRFRLAWSTRTSHAGGRSRSVGALS